MNRENIHFQHVPGYFRMAHVRLLEVVEACMTALREADIQFDTIAVQGTSGMLVGPTLAAFTDAHLVIIPKPGDTSPHRDPGPIGVIGERWIFVDDLIASGTTHERVQEAIEEKCPEAIEVGFLQYNPDEESWDIAKPRVTKLTY